MLTMGVWHIILTVVLTFKQALALPNPVQINELQDGHVYQGSDIESEEMNLNILICSFNRLNFQIVNQNGYSRKYIDKIKENNSCQVYKISSSDNAVVISRNDTVLKKFKRSTMKRFSIKSYSTDTVWTILSLCSDNLGRKRLCRVNCPPGVCKDMGSSKNLDKPIHNETTTFGISKKIYSFQSSIASLLHPENTNSNIGLYTAMGLIIFVAGILGCLVFNCISDKIKKAQRDEENVRMLE